MTTQTLTITLTDATIQPAPAPLTVSVELEAQPVLCVCCDKPATMWLQDWDLCEEHFNELSAADPALDLEWAAYVAEMTEALCTQE